MKKTTLVFLLLVVISTMLIAGCTTKTIAITPTTTPAPAPAVTAVPTYVQNQQGVAIIKTVNVTATPTAAPPMKTIVETAVADGRFTTLVAAVQAAKLDGALSGTGPFTVFAPTDDAFKNLPPGTVASLLKEPEGQLKQILLYHVVDGKVMAADVVKLTSAKTLQGSNVNITVTNGVVKINDATVIITDIQTKNGVIHVIDKVLLPPSNLVQEGDQRPGIYFRVLFFTSSMTVRYTLHPIVVDIRLTRASLVLVWRADLHGDHPLPLIMEKNPCFDRYLKPIKIQDRLFQQDTSERWQNISNSPVKSEISQRMNLFINISLSHS